MKIVLAFDSFKGSLTAEEAVTAAREGVLSVLPDAEIVALPLADGGEGTAAALCRLLNAQWRTCTVHDPLKRKIESRYAVCNKRLDACEGKTAIMEMASAAGLTLLGEGERNPMKTTTFGVGEMILDAVRHGCGHILIGIGGSATNDGGMGMLAALGVRFLDEKGEPLKPVGESLCLIRRIDWTGLAELRGVAIDVACDVQNPLFGRNGAAYVYASQKGADDREIELLDIGLRNYAGLCHAAFETEGHPARFAEAPGSGAAGGLGFALLLLGAVIRSGTDVILDAADFDRQLQDADLVITGEGRIDRQTLNGKLPLGILRRAASRQRGIPTIALAGQVEDGDLLLRAGFRSVRSINTPDMSAEEAMKPEKAKENLRRAVISIVEGF